ncbi:AAA family ATPase [Thalassoglobus sp. JC818]|uniref:AAA family ATPase n=1 Tax=Thalassoglobus sp. JC818 TaxID=3232136 RepID=UPI00345A85E5
MQRDTFAGIDNILLSLGLDESGSFADSPSGDSEETSSGDSQSTQSAVSEQTKTASPDQHAASPESESGEAEPGKPVIGDITRDNYDQARAHLAKIEAARRLAKANEKPQSDSPPNKYPSLRGASEFSPKAPDSLEQAGLNLSDVMNLIIKYLASRGVETGYKIALQIGLNFGLVEAILRQLKIERLAAYKNAIAGGDYLYELTDLGRERARILSDQTTYFGTAPVPLEQYIASVHAQSLEGRKPSLNAIRRAFSDLDISDRMISNIGQAIHSGRGMFLYGPPGNGKTSMAERVTKSFGDTIWIPRAIIASGEILRLYDPNRHREVPISDDAELKVDGRWVRIERPTIVAGGELQMDNLEITYIRKTGVGEAPLQMKANCGTLLIDDFGRQRMSTDELLNRWIVPLEQRHDYLHLESGRTIQVPFDQLIIFSSNLEPRDLVDDAFLRRIPYKIEVKDATEDEFRALFCKQATQQKFSYTNEVIDYMIIEHYVQANRPFRFCHPRDLLRQILNRCSLHNLPREITKDSIDQAVENYFSIM